MEPNFHWINLIILFGAVQAIIFSIILFFSKKHPGAKYLSLFVFVFAYNGFETFNWSANIRHIFFDLSPFVVIFALGPSLYLYVRSLLYSHYAPRFYNVLLFYSPVIIQFVVRIAIFIYHVLWLNYIIDSEISGVNLHDYYSLYSEPLSVVIFVFFLIKSILSFRKANQEQLQLRRISREGQLVVYQWLKALLISSTGFAVFWTITVAVPYVYPAVSYDEHYYPIELALALFMYWLVLKGFYRTRQISRKERVIESSHDQELISKLVDAMEKHRLYLNPELNLAAVSKHTGIPARTISSVLNQLKGISFNEFVNHYRVNEVKNRLETHAANHLTISAIALESGFNSQATFQRAFRAVCNMSPKEFMARHHDKRNVSPSFNDK